MGVPLGTIVFVRVGCFFHIRHVSALVHAVEALA